MQSEQGSISINTEDIFPIIKKWLYSDKDIFIRELVSNCADAENKLARLSGIGEAEVGDDNVWRVTVTVDSDAKTLSFEDNGIGMTADEVKKYINQIAFSGARDFLEKYKDDAASSQIIGHFGLGFYSAFMVSSSVEIDTLSYLPGSEAVHWVSDGSSSFEISASERTSRGTLVTLHLSDDGAEFSDYFTVKTVLLKYFSFLPFELYCRRPSDPMPGEVVAEVLGEDGKPAKDSPKPLEKLNDQKPLWMRAPQDCTPDDYKKFYKDTFSDFRDPLFWIHLNIDYPFRMKGILYFPRLRDEMGNMEGEVKLYCNQVFVADNIKEVIPDYLLLLKGCIDCPDLPLNVSRSFLQNDGTVMKLRSHITRKVSDKLASMFELEREDYQKYWDDIHPFIKFGCIRDEKFYDKLKDALLVKTTKGEYLTLGEYAEKYGEKNPDDAAAETSAETADSAKSSDSAEASDNAATSEKKDEPKKKATVYYTSDPAAQSQYVSMFEANGIEPVVLDHIIDNPFISMVESKRDDVHFARIDSDVSSFSKDAEALSPDKLAEYVKPLDADVKVSVSDMGADAPAAVMLLGEQSRRFREMMKQWGGGSQFPDKDDDRTLVFNSSNDLVKYAAEGGSDDARLVAEHLYDLALMGFRPMKAEETGRFVKREMEILSRIAK